jgi:glycosyltransferase involved in cell wall biosynthesis
VLFIGASFYNNWYLSRQLRQHGWTADTFVSSAEGAEDYIHGSDFYLSEFAGPYPDVDSETRNRIAAMSEEYRKWVRGDTPETVTAWGYEPPQGSFGLIRRWLGRCFRRFHHDFPVEKMSTPALLAALRTETEPCRLRKLLKSFLSRIQPNPHPLLMPLYEAHDRYDILHFTAINNMRLFYYFYPSLFGDMPIGWDLDIYRRLGKKIVYSNIGCMDGVTQTSFSKWGPESVCSICRWRNEPSVCSDERNRTWGALRNQLADYQVLGGGNRVDYNDDPRVHEVPEFYNLDPTFWRPDLPIPEQHRLEPTDGVVRIYHAVGNYAQRTNLETKVNIKTTHLIVPAVEKLKADGYPVELVFCTNIPNREVRYYQLQSDIVVDMLTYGFFGANIREAMMLGKPAVCFLRPEWLESMRAEVPGYVDELPVVSATPQTIYQVLVDLVTHPEKRRELGRRGREFALRWHSKEAAAQRFDRIYTELLKSRRVRTPSAPPCHDPLAANR